MVGCVGLGEELPPQSRQQGIQRHQEVLRGETAPALVPHGLVPGGAAPAPECHWIRVADQHARQPVAVLDPGVGGGANSLVLTQNVQDLGPEPFGRVDASLVFGVVLATPGSGHGVDLVGLRHRRVVLPQHEHGVGVVGEFRLHSQGHAVAIHGDRRRAGGVHADADDVLGSICRGRGQGVCHHRLQAVEVVERMLTELVAPRVAVPALTPARISTHVHAHFFTGPGIDEHGAHRVGAIVETQRVLPRHGPLLHRWHYPLLRAKILACSSQKRNRKGLPRRWPGRASRL